MKLFDAVRANQYSILVITIGRSDLPLYRSTTTINFPYIQHWNITKILTGQTPLEADDIYNTHQPARAQFDKFHKRYEEERTERAIGRHSRYTLFVSVENVYRSNLTTESNNDSILPIVYELMTSFDNELLVIVLEEVPLHVETRSQKIHERCIHIPYHPLPKTISEANKYTKTIMDKVSLKVDKWLRNNQR